jgi:hypothetical protein
VKAVLAELEKTPKAVLDHQANAGKQKDNKAKEDKAKHSGGSAKVGLASTYVVELILVRSETPARRDGQGQYSLLGPKAARDYLHASRIDNCVTCGPTRIAVSL